MPPPKIAMKKIQWWLKARFGKEFKDLGDSLEHGLQDDYTSCGILTSNTVAHDVFGDEIWTCENKFLERVKWFVILSEAHINDVGLNSILYHFFH